ncbi:MAG: hypothetical protein ACEQSX_12835 [Baekduiaceae bacterium]
MGLDLSTHAGLPQHTQTVTLDGTQFRMRLTWRHRLQGWYLDLYTLDETPLLLARRLSPGWSPNLGLAIEGGPDGVLLVTGFDGYVREDLGESLRLRYYTRAELAAAAPEVEVPSTVTIS